MPRKLTAVAAAGPPGRGAAKLDQRIRGQGPLARSGRTRDHVAQAHRSAPQTREPAMTETPPPVTGFHHFSATVSDAEASAQWYERVFGMSRVPVTFPHYGDEEGGYAVLMMDPKSGVTLGLHHHEANPGESFAENRTGLDHISFSVASRADLDAWAAWL